MDQAMEYPGYDSYRDSGIDWVGSIPSHWDTDRAKWLFKKEERPVRPEDEIVTAFRDGVVTLRSNRRTEGFTNALQEHGYQGIRKGDLVIHAMDAFAGAIGVSDADGKSTPVYAACVNRGEYYTNNHYYAYLLRYMSKAGYIEALAKGIRERSTDFRFNDFAKLALPIPPRDEQDRIASFLDQKTAEIDEAIAKKQQLIELLKEQKAILINQAVTKGLNPEAPMRDSGVEWIGGVPGHWLTTKLKHLIDLLPGFAFKSDLYSTDETDVPLLRGVNINPGRVKWDETVYWPKDKVQNYEKYRLMAGDFVLGMDRPWISSGVRVAQISEADLPCLLLQRVARIRASGGLDSTYLGLLLRSEAFLAYFEPMLSGISVPHISPEQIGNFLTAIPPLGEQQKISEYAALVSNEHDSLVSKERKIVAVLQEYKSSLVSEAVTGKIKV
jgi:type I restriction enzyme S subunit